MKNLAKLRKENGLSQQKLGNEIGLARNTICQYESGNRVPDVDTLVRIADYFNVTVDYLLGREIKNQPTPTMRTDSKTKPIPHTMIKKSIIRRDKDTGLQYEYQVNKQCPICQFPTDPEPLITLPLFREQNENKGNKRVGFYSCNSCGKIFSVLYENPLRTDIFNGKDYDVHFGIATPIPTVDSCYTPYRSAVPELPKAFDKPEFAKFRQAYEDLCWAKDYQIDGLVGMAYRRVIDFLIRDYFLYAQIDFYKDIKTAELHYLIEAIEEKEIRTFAERVNWLANDYTHYVDEHPDYNVTDIEEFFNIILRVLSDNISYNKALKILSRYQKKNNIQPQNEPIAVKENFVPSAKLAEEYQHLFTDGEFVKIAKVYDNTTIEAVKGILVGYFLATAKANGVDTLSLVGY